MAEMMIATAIGVIVMAGVLTTYVLCLKQFTAISNYAEIHRGGRKSVDIFSRDLRAVRGIQSFGTSNMVVVIPTAFGTSGNVTAYKLVTYTVQNGALWRTDSSSSNKVMLTTNIYSFAFSLYDHLGSNTSVVTSAKGIQVDIKLRKTVMSQIQSEDFLSARLDMRNVP
jgi:Tfp pilus assembly protein PilW